MRTRSLTVSCRLVRATERWPPCRLTTARVWATVSKMGSRRCRLNPISASSTGMPVRMRPASPMRLHLGPILPDDLRLILGHRLERGLEGVAGPETLRLRSGQAPALFATRHRSWWGKRGGGRRSFVRALSLGYNCSGHYSHGVRGKWIQSLPTYLVDRIATPSVRYAPR